MLGEVVTETGRERNQAGDPGLLPQTGNPLRARWRGRRSANRPARCSAPESIRGRAASRPALAPSVDRNRSKANHRARAPSWEALFADGPPPVGFRMHIVWRDAGQQIREPVARPPLGLYQNTLEGGNEFYFCSFVHLNFIGKSFREPNREAIAPLVPHLWLPSCQPCFYIVYTQPPVAGQVLKSRRSVRAVRQGEFPRRSRLIISNLHRTG